MVKIIELIEEGRIDEAKELFDGPDWLFGQIVEANTKGWKGDIVKRGSEDDRNG